VLTRGVYCPLALWEREYLLFSNPQVACSRYLGAMPTPHEYYEQLAPRYDQDRFGNAYGRYVDHAERAHLARWLRGHPPARVVDLGCGTGRLLSFAHTGVDASAAMLAQAQAKHPDRHLVQADLAHTGLPAQAFDAALCFHVLMHLAPPAIEAFFQEAARLVRPGGHVVVDIPSAPRRAWGRRAAVDWHGSTAATLADVQRWAGPAWRLRSWRGLLWVPIHRLPAMLRPWAHPVDQLLGGSPLGKWSSYYLCVLERQA
jgi:SAM-dependent methyltransferase